MKHLLLLPIVLLACSDYPASEGNDSEENPIEIHIKIDNQNNQAPDNNTQEVDVDSNSDSSSDSDSSSNSDSSSESTLDNSTGIQVYDFNSIL